MIIEKKEADYNMFEWWHKVVFKNYATFSGRARRKEFWYFFLLNTLILFSLSFFMGMVMGAVVSSDGNAADTVSIIMLILFFGFYLVMLIPFLAVSARRLHDTGKSGWWTIICIIPYVSLIGWIILIVFWASAGEKGPNQYGLDPKGNNDLEIDKIGTE
ncbi:DUF805 domain-containing protein [Aureisphaera galaxeae]|uniref:DUF805 domain-containing protein n=1 Tax=Aureisphaera galaxeae TaxID=1538023 RepID=UPI0023504665|nr:DUF805 domain-containing protein [Aureisphaera galaxeae]MDC8005704.1 DUF805 domain-containing protein [Aureisphaera galaxeae]